MQLIIETVCLKIQETRSVKRSICPTPELAPINRLEFCHEISRKRPSILFNYDDVIEFFQCQRSQ